MDGSKYAPTAGEIVVVETLPACDFCADGTPAEFDFKTKYGPWANGCESHWHANAANPALGVGIGQRLITNDQAI